MLPNFNLQSILFASTTINATHTCYLCETNRKRFHLQF